MMSRIASPGPSLVLVAMLFVACQDSPVAPPATRPALAASLLGRSESQSDGTFNFTTIDFPGALSTSAQDVNAGGDIVGTYMDVSHHSHGYLLRDGQFTTIDFPGSAFTEVNGIGPDGELVGDYSFAGAPGIDLHGYLRTKVGEFVPVNSPGHAHTIVQHILPDGTMLGCRHDGDLMASMRGIIVSREGYAEMATYASMETGATPDGRRIVGFYTNMAAANRVEGFLIHDGEFTPLFVPGSTLTRVIDMNAAGEIIGNYMLAGVFHGFMLTDAGYESINVPGATATRVFGINSRSDVVGLYVAPDGKTHGFLANLK